MFTADWFLALDGALRAAGLDADDQSFDEIKANLARRRVCSPDEFASAAAYVVLAGGFSQKTAKKIHAKIMDALCTRGADFDALIALFHNKNKIRAICDIWGRRAALCAGYYACRDTDARVKYLGTLPHIGKITANHLARNLGEDVVKYDVWIQRLGVCYGGDDTLYKMIDNGKLCDTVRDACDAMFGHLVRETGLPRGYIDVVLWRACQCGLIQLDAAATTKDL